jgi:hypothetical protein
MELVNTASAGNSYFPKSIGSTLVTLSYFPLYKAIALMNSLSKRTQGFLENQVNNVFGECVPTVFCSQFEHLKTFKGGEPRFC